MIAILIIAGSVITFGLLAVGLFLYALNVASNYDDMLLDFEDGEGW